MTLRRQRLDRLVPGLSLEQRMAALIGFYQANGTLDDTLLRDVPPEQSGRFSYQVGLLGASHRMLGLYLFHISEVVRQCELRYGLLLSLRLRAIEAEPILTFLQSADVPGKDGPVEDLGRRVLTAELRQNPGAGAVEQMARRLFEEVVATLVCHWGEVRIAEMAADVLTEELGGHYPLRAENRALLQGCRERLLRVHSGLLDWGFDVELPEPTSADLDVLLDILDREAAR